MAYKPAGIKEVYLAPGSAAFPADGAGAIGLGYKDSGMLKIGPFGEIKTKQGRVYPSLTNFRAEIRTEQISFALMKFLIQACQVSDVTAKIITSGIAKAENFTASGGLFTFENAKSLGLDWELTLSPKERLLMIGLERAFKPTDATAIITAAKTDTLPGDLNIPNLDDANIIKGYINPSFGGVSIADDRLNDWKITMKSRSSKNSMNKSNVSAVDIEIFGVLDGADPDEILSYLASAIAPDITITMGVETPYDIVLESGGLTQMGEAEIDDEKRTATVRFTGSYEIDFTDVTGSDIVFKAKL